MVIIGDVDVDAIISNPDTVNLEMGNIEHNNKKRDHSSH